MNQLAAYVETLADEESEMMSCPVASPSNDSHICARRVSKPSVGHDSSDTSGCPTDDDELAFSPNNQLTACGRTVSEPNNPFGSSGHHVEFDVGCDSTAPGQQCAARTTSSASEPLHMRSASICPAVAHKPIGSISLATKEEIAVWNKFFLTLSLALINSVDAAVESRKKTYVSKKSKPRSGGGHDTRRNSSSAENRRRSTSKH